MSATGTASAGGQTLVELLVALAIAATMLGAARLAFPDPGAQRARQAAARAAGLLGLACERAELAGAPIGASVAGTRLVFVQPGDGEWQPFREAPDEPLRPRVLDDAVALRLRSWDAAMPSAASVAGDVQVLCSADGDLLPVVLELRGPGREAWDVQASADGAIRVEDTGAR